jgi:murein DD-endopeptidase MepM/ murein hydrolase activator NlpD
VASVHEYKRFENSIVQKVKGVVYSAAKAAAGFFRAVFRVISRRYTVVFVPHSEKNVYNLHVTVFSICCFFLVLIGIMGAFLWYGASYRSTRGILANKDSRLRDIQASLDQLRDETARLLQEARGFEAALSGTLSALGADAGSHDAASLASTGDLSSFFGVEESSVGLLPEVNDLRRVSGYLSRTVEPLKELGVLLNSQSAFLTEIPSIWPIKGGIGHISMFFGQNENPFTGQYYIHKGIDISTYRSGDPIVATADGQVVTVDFDQEGFGNYVIIKHKHGYYTRYGHMLKSRVKNGQRVQQGEVIGYIGNTGLSTGPHVHYEVHVGSDVVDPYKYINFRSSIARTTR